jgi:hypothetical protein
VAEQGHYVLTVDITPETKAKMIADGVPDKGMVGQLFKQDDQGNLSYKCKRPHFNPRLNKGEGEVMGAPVVMDAASDLWDESVVIGKDSKLKIRLDVWDDKIVTLQAVRVLELQEYTPDTTGLAGF